MEVHRRTAAGKSFLDVLVGVEAGVLGGLAMLVCFIVAMPLLGQPWYFVPKLFGDSFIAHGQEVFTPGLPTLSGAASIILSAGIVGSINGLLTPGGRWFSLIVAAVWYVVSYLFLWKKLAPLVLFHAPQPVLIMGFFVFGSVIGWQQWLVAHTRARWSH